MLGKVVQIVEVDDAFAVSFYYVLGQKQAAGNIFGNFAGHIVALDTIDGRVLVGVFFFSFFAAAFDKADNAIIGSVSLTQ